MADSVNPIRPDGRLSRTALDRLGESTSRQESLFGGMPRINMTGGEGDIQGPADSFWIRIDEVGANGAYAATEVAREAGQAAGTADQPPGDKRQWFLPDAANPNNLPAYEVNLSTDVALNSIHRAWNSGEQGVIEFDAAAADDCDKCFAHLCVTRDAGTGFITNIYYVNSSGIQTLVPDCTPTCVAIPGCPVTPANYEVTFTGLSGSITALDSADADCLNNDLQGCCSCYNLSYKMALINNPPFDCFWATQVAVCGDADPLGHWITGVSLRYIPSGPDFDKILLQMVVSNDADSGTWNVTATYATTRSSWSCAGANVLTFVGVTTGGSPPLGFGNLCGSTWPATITATPVV